MSLVCSMNREAAALGTLAWSVYAGKLAAVDRALAVAAHQRRPRGAARRPAAGAGAPVNARQVRLFHVAGAPTSTNAAPHRRTGGAVTFLVTH